MHNKIMEIRGSDGQKKKTKDEIKEEACDHYSFVYLEEGDSEDETTNDLL